jgi:hypothetical protein
MPAPAAPRNAGQQQQAQQRTGTSSSAFGKAVIWRRASRPRLPSEAERVTMMPVPTAMTSAGTWVTMPSPTVSSV